MEKRIDLTIENTVILLFSVLPVVDSLNGLLIQWNLPSIGTAYKMGVLGILCWYVIRNRYFQRPVLIAVAAAAGYLCFSVGINLLLSGKLHTPSHPIKLGFNILTFGALVSLWQGKAISGRSIYRILSNNAWLMIVMILVPYVLGLGNTIYHGGIGYKAFFYSNNELSVALLILFFFCLYRIARKMNLWNLVQFGGITVCMLLLSTKSAIAACILGVGAFCLEYLLRKDAKYRKHLLIAGGVILLVGHQPGNGILAPPERPVPAVRWGHPGHFPQRPELPAGKSLGRFYPGAYLPASADRQRLLLGASGGDGFHRCIFLSGYHRCGRLHCLLCMVLFPESPSLP